jgi:hypothetical protein
LFRFAYTSESTIAALNANGLCYSFVLLSGMVNELLLHGGAKLDVSRLVNATVEIIG